MRMYCAFCLTGASGVEGVLGFVGVLGVVGCIGGTTGGVSSISSGGVLSSSIGGISSSGGRGEVLSVCSVSGTRTSSFALHAKIGVSRDRERTSAISVFIFFIITSRARLAPLEEVLGAKTLISCKSKMDIL